VKEDEEEREERDGRRVSRYNVFFFSLEEMQIRNF